MTDTLFQAVMAEAEINDDMRLSFGTPTLDLFSTPPLNLYHAMMSEVWQARVEKRVNSTFKTGNFSEWAEIKAKSPQERADMVGLIGLRLYQTYLYANKTDDEFFGYISSIRGAETRMISELCRSKLPFTETHILALIHSIRSQHGMDVATPIPQTMKAIEQFLVTNPMSALLHDSLTAFKAECHEEKTRLVSKLLQQTEDHLASILSDHA
ncbi:MAG: hypothetical protein ABJ327_18395 [Litoreibacter sp.]